MRKLFYSFPEMQFKGLKWYKVTMVSLLLACTHLGAFELGMWLHAYIMKENIEMNVPLGTAIVYRYAKCGSIENALMVLKSCLRKML